MKVVYELDSYKLAEKLPDMILDDFDKWSERAQRASGYQFYDKTTHRG
jgi:hypothetical protein